MKNTILIIVLFINNFLFGQTLIEETFQNKGNTKFVSEKKAFYKNQTFINSDSSYTKKRFDLKNDKLLYIHNYKSLSPIIKQGIQINYFNSDTTYFDDNFPVANWYVMDYFKGTHRRINYDFEINYIEISESNLLHQFHDIFPVNSKELSNLDNSFIDLNNYIDKNRYVDMLNIEKSESIALNDKSKIVKVSFRLDEDGNPKDVSIVEGLHPIYDKEAVRLVINYPNWKQTINNSNNDDYIYILQIHFYRILNLN